MQRRATYMYMYSVVHHTTIDTTREHPQQGGCPMWRLRKAGVDTGQAYGQL